MNIKEISIKTLNFCILYSIINILTKDTEMYLKGVLLFQPKTGFKEVLLFQSKTGFKEVLPFRPKMDLKEMVEIPSFL